MVEFGYQILDSIEECHDIIHQNIDMGGSIGGISYAVQYLYNLSKIFRNMAHFSGNGVYDYIGRNLHRCGRDVEIMAGEFVIGGFHPIPGAPLQFLLQ